MRYENVKIREYTEVLPRINHLETRMVEVIRSRPNLRDIQHVTYRHQYAINRADYCIMRLEYLRLAIRRGLFYR